MKINTYYLKARLFPAILTSIPILLLFFTYIAPIFSNKLDGVLKFLSIATNVSISSASIFLLVQINRLVAKEVFQRIFFRNEMRMPTTDYLLHSSQHFPAEVRARIEKLISTKYKINLLSAPEELEDQDKARNAILTAIAQIRNTLRDNPPLLQHNIEYGFMRNLIGGSLVAVIASATIYFIAQNRNDLQMTSTGAILTLIYLIPVLLSPIIIKRYGEYYAKILFEQFLALKR